MIVHYMMPHSPFVTNKLNIPDSERWKPGSHWMALKRGETSLKYVHEAYLDSIRTVLGHVKTLLSNVDAEKVVISADHGEAFGEYGFYNHPYGLPLPEVRKVPWIETCANDSGKFESEYQAPVSSEAPTDGVNELLEQMGYR
jgi:glucan phosphoethanolaminetransferase (alkaline phosphatase superfamily)